MLVVLHEFGHFIVARRNGVEVEEFGIGFPPRLWGKRFKDDSTEYTINLLPFGGFVKLKGENDEDRRPHSLGSASLAAKAKIMLAGVAMNLLAAFVLFTFLALIGIPKANLEALPFNSRPQFQISSDTKVISSRLLVAVAPGSPADKAGLKDGDELLSIAGETVGDPKILPEVTKKHAGETVAAVFKRKGKQQNVSVTLNKERTDEQGYLGVVATQAQILRSTWSAPIVGAGLVAQYTEITFKGLGYVVSNLFQGNTRAVENSVGGPVATVQVLSDKSVYGFRQILFVLGLISLSLAIMNSLPIPALDGGRLFVTVLFRVLRKPLTKSKEDMIHGTGFAVLLLMIVAVSVIDVKRIIGG